MPENIKKEENLNPSKTQGSYKMSTGVHNHKLEDIDVGVVLGILEGPINRLSKAEPSNVQEIVASQIELLSVYHHLVLDQARRSFFWAIVSAAVGLIFLIAALGFILSQQLQNAAIISLISGVLTEFIAAINFYLYNKTSTQLADFQLRLDRTQRFLLANSMCESLDGESKNKARIELMRAVAGVHPVAPEPSLQPLNSSSTSKE